MAVHVFRQVAASLVLSQTHMVLGVLVSYGGLLVSSAESGELPYLTTGQVTWVLSAPSFGTAIGSLLAAPLNNSFGVLRVIVLTSALNVCSWVALCLGESLPVLLLGRLLSGLFVGINIGGSRIYIAEVASERLRGVLCHQPSLAMAASFLGSFALSRAVPWRYAVLACGCLPTGIHLVGALLLPPSARWLVAHGGSEQAATRCVRFYRGRQHDVAAELKSIQASLGGGGRAASLLRQLRLVLTDWDCAKPVLLLCGQFLFDSFCGGMTIAQYAPAVFRRAAPQLDPNLCTLYLAAFQLAALLVSGLLVSRVGRRTVLALAATCGALGCGLVASALLVPALAGYGWLPLLGVLLANAAAQAGIAPVSYLYLSELLPTVVRPLVGSSFVVYISICTIAGMHLFPLATAAVGTHGLFLMMAGFCVLQLTYALVVLPETKDLTLEDVQVRHFSSKRRAEDAARAETAAAGDTVC